MSNSVQPRRRQPTRLPRPWDSPGKNTGVGCHFLLQCTKVKSESKVAQSCLTLSDPMDCSLPGSFVHGSFQARVLEWGAFAFSADMPRCSFLATYNQVSLLFCAWSIGCDDYPSRTELISLSFRSRLYSIIWVKLTNKTSSPSRIGGTECNKAVS